eukprot:GILK01006525.1.p1 GENE.GILK01006525.1~~GILK01006525.1.p1  ORF type:complete len:497 (-),score=51.15 GILK01006525.1:253-1707(-)
MSAHGFPVFNTLLSRNALSQPAMEVGPVGIGKPRDYGSRGLLKTRNYHVLASGVRHSYERQYDSFMENTVKRWAQISAKSVLTFVLPTDIFLRALLALAPLSIILWFAVGVERIPILLLLVTLLALLAVNKCLVDAVEGVVDHCGVKMGSTLNAVLSNAPELVIAAFALVSGYPHIARSSIVGVFLAHTLFLCGTCLIYAGTKTNQSSVQSMNRQFSCLALRSQVTQLQCLTMFVCVPTVSVFASTVGSAVPSVPDQISVQHMIPIASVMLAAGSAVLFVVSLVYSLKCYWNSRADCTASPSEIEPLSAVLSSYQEREDLMDHEPERPLTASILVLILSMATLVLLCYILVSTLGHGAFPAELHGSPLFVGVVLLGSLGVFSRTPHALTGAALNRFHISVDLAITSASGMLLLGPVVLMLCGLCMGFVPPLVLSIAECLCVLVATTALSRMVNEGKVDILQGVLFLAIYAMMGVLFWCIGRPAL